MRCVIADDNGICLAFLRGLITTDLGWQVVGEAKTGKQAIEVCQKVRPDVAILDVNMEPVNGDQAAREILENGYAGTVILATTAQHMVTDFRARGFKAISKPYKRGGYTAERVREALNGGTS